MAKSEDVKVVVHTIELSNAERDIVRMALDTYAKVVERRIAAELNLGIKDLLKVTAREIAAVAVKL